MTTVNTRSRFSHFDGYYVALIDGEEIARFAPSPFWGAYAGSMLNDPAFSYGWVNVDRAPGRDGEPSTSTPDESWATPDDLCYAPGTLLRDSTGSFWMVRDDGKTAVGTNGGIMVDLRRGERVFLPYVTQNS